eukprot:PhM_4_TR7572/c1_g1_i1/m.7769
MRQVALAVLGAEVRPQHDEVKRVRETGDVVGLELQPLQLALARHIDGLIRLDDDALETSLHRTVKGTQNVLDCADGRGLHDFHLVSMLRDDDLEPLAPMVQRHSRNVLSLNKQQIEGTIAEPLLLGGSGCRRRLRAAVNGSVDRCRPNLGALCGKCVRPVRPELFELPLRGIPDQHLTIQNGGARLNRLQNHGVELGAIHVGVVLAVAGPVLHFHPVFVYHDTLAVVLALNGEPRLFQQHLQLRRINVAGEHRPERLHQGHLRGMCFHSNGRLSAHKRIYICALLAHRLETVGRVERVQSVRVERAEEGRVLNMHPHIFEEDADKPLLLHGRRAA